MADAANTISNTGANLKQVYGTFAKLKKKLKTK